jgi:hypothetical protein
MSLGSFSSWPKIKWEIHEKKTPDAYYFIRFDRRSNQSGFMSSNGTSAKRESASGSRSCRPAYGRLLGAFIGVAPQQIIKLFSHLHEMELVRMGARDLRFARSVNLRRSVRWTSGGLGRISAMLRGRDAWPARRQENPSTRSIPFVRWARSCSPRCI